VSAESSIVDIAREFLAVHRALRGIAGSFRAGALRFDDLERFVGDDERSALFRLKERCHTLFRSDTASGEPEIGPSALFDLAVGSLFHEAMKLRENFYQSAVYAPKVDAVRAAGVADAGGLLREFDKIVRDARTRTAESVAESETLLRQTTAQFRELLRDHLANGRLARFLVEQRDALAEVLGGSPDGALAALYGSAGAAWRRAATSYLTSGFFTDARGALAEAAAHGDTSADVARQRAYADGMSAFLAGRYDEALRGLSAWLDGRPEPSERKLAELAIAASSRIGQLVEGDAALGERAAAVTQRLRELPS
jgi:hypothetical protein